MPYGPNTELLTRMAQHYADEVAEFSLHSGETDETGDNELIGVSRQAAVWTLNGTTADAATVTFTVPDDTTIEAVGMWADDGTFLDSSRFSVYMPSAGTVDVTMHWGYQEVAE